MNDNATDRRDFSKADVGFDALTRRVSFDKKSYLEAATMLFAGGKVTYEGMDLEFPTRSDARRAAGYLSPRTKARHRHLPAPFELRVASPAPVVT